MSSPNIPDDAIKVHYGSLALQFGIGNIPNLFMRFYRHLVHTPAQGEPLRLSDAEAMLLVHVMALRSEDDFVLRLSNLPMVSPLRKREDYLGKFRKMGLVFTIRLYYSRAEMMAYYGADNLPASPRMRAQQWDLSPLIYNLTWVAQEYLKRQREAVAKWQKTGEVGRRPVTELPADFQHEIILPPDVIASIRSGIEDPNQAVYYPVPAEWKKLASVPAQNRPVQESSVPAQNRLVQDSVPAQIRPIQDAVPAPTKPVHGLYQPDSGRSSMLPFGLTPADAGGPQGGPLAPELPDSRPDTPDAGEERSANTPGAPGNGDVQRDTPVARVPGKAQTRVAMSEPPQPGGNGNEPLPVRRERVLRDLRDHANDRRTQIYIVAVNIGQMMGLRWMDGQLRTHPIKEDKAEIGKMCREHGGPAHIWAVACRVAGHEIAGDPLDYLWGRLKAERVGNGQKGQGSYGAGADLDGLTGQDYLDDFLTSGVITPEQAEEDYGPLTKPPGGKKKRGAC